MRHIIINDINYSTVEGVRHREFPLLSIQYHEEASYGPQDMVNAFERFIDMVQRMMIYT